MKPTEKLSYLLSSLEGEARETVSGLQIINDNYAVALDLLKKRFGKPGLTLDAIYKALNDMKTCRNIPKECRDTFNEIGKYLWVIEHTGENMHHNHLRTMVTSKFSHEILYMSFEAR